MPMIGAGCTHLDRFDKASYESFNGQLSPTCAKRCPRCEAPLEAKDLRVCELTLRLLRSTGRGSIVFGGRESGSVEHTNRVAIDAAKGAYAVLERDDSSTFFDDAPLPAAMAFTPSAATDVTTTTTTTTTTTATTSSSSGSIDYSGSSSSTKEDPPVVVAADVVSEPLREPEQAGSEAGEQPGGQDDVSSAGAAAAQSSGRGQQPDAQPDEDTEMEDVQESQEKGEDEETEKEKGENAKNAKNANANADEQEQEETAFFIDVTGTGGGGGEQLGVEETHEDSEPPENTATDAPEGPAVPAPVPAPVQVPAPVVAPVPVPVPVPVPAPEAVVAQPVAQEGPSSSSSSPSSWTWFPLSELSPVDLSSNPSAATVRLKPVAKPLREEGEEELSFKCVACEERKVGEQKTFAPTRLYFILYLSCLFMHFLILNSFLPSFFP